MRYNSTADVSYLKIIEDVKTCAEHDVWLFSVTFKDFKQIFKRNFEYEFQVWAERYLNGLNLAGADLSNSIEYVYEKSYCFPDDDRVRQHLYDLVKYYNFITSNTQPYRIPLCIQKTNSIYQDDLCVMFHPGNARLHCMHHWPDDQIVKILITDYGFDNILQRLSLDCIEKYSFRHSDPEEIATFLKLKTWKNVFFKYTPVENLHLGERPVPKYPLGQTGVGLGEHHDKLPEYNKDYTIQYNINNFVVNGVKIMYIENNVWKLAKP